MPKGSVLVCVTAQHSSHALIRRGREIAQKESLPLLVLSVCGTGPNLLELPGVVQTLDDLYRASSEAGAEMTMLTSSDPRTTIAQFARDHHVSHLVLGQGTPSPHSFAVCLASDLPDVIVHTEMAEVPAGL